MQAIADEEWLDIEREFCSRSLAGFVKRAWHVLEPNQEYIHGWHIDAMSEHLEAVTYFDINRLLVNVPPGTMKSMLVNVFWPAWEWGPKGLPGNRIIGASHSERLAIRDCLKMRSLISSEWYQQLWPIAFEGDQNEKKSFQNRNTGWRQACAVKAMTGNRGDRVLWDDPHNVEDSYSKAKLETAIRVFRETLPTRLNSPEKSAIIVVMQRLNDADVSGEILSGEYDYEHLCLPMEFEKSRKCITSIGFEDPRQDDGELLFPERFPESVLIRDKKAMGSYAVAGQFQQRPTPLGGGLIKGEHFNLYEVPPRMKYRMLYGDTAMKTAERNDYSVLSSWGKGENGKLYLLDLLRGKWESHELERRAVAFWYKHKALDAQLGSLRKLMVEDKASGTGLIQKLKHDGKVPVDGIPRNKDKYTRFMSVAGYIESGYVCLPSGAAFLSDFISECESFTADDTHQHDDQVDTMFDAINDMIVVRKTTPYFGYL